MNYRSKITATALLAFLICLTGSMLALRKVNELRGPQAPLEEILYIPSGKTLKKLSLGYSSLLADIYWTRAVQYFGSKHLEHASHHELLYPLLDITTDLDPHLIPAYQSGSIFLSQPFPQGAGEPDKAVALLEKGTKANPEYWRLFFTLGFVHYLDRNDPQAAQQAFQKGSEVPGALPFMKVMAADMAERASKPETALRMWQLLYDSKPPKDVQENAINHIRSLQAELNIRELEGLAKRYRANSGNWPAHWGDMVRAGVLGGIPVDPTGQAYRLLPGGKVALQDPQNFPFYHPVEQR